MAGHSKWANIRHRKGAQDAKRGRLFAKLSKEITVAAIHGQDPIMNASLRLAISKAKAQSMPKKNIENAIEKANTSAGKTNFKELLYGANVAGVSFLIVCLTDNVNRTSSSLQHIISRFNGSIAGANSVSYIFDRKGVLEISADGQKEEEIMLISLDAGAEDFEKEKESFYIYVDPQKFSKVKDKLEKKNITTFKTAEVKYLPNQEIKLPQAKAEKMLDFIELLEDEDDIQSVYHNLDATSFD